MKKLLIVYGIAYSFIASQVGYADMCKANNMYRDRKAYYLDRQGYNKCVTEARKRAEEYRQQRLREKALEAIIEANDTYQRNSKDIRRLFYEKYHQEN